MYQLKYIYWNLNFFEFWKKDDNLKEFFEILF